MQNKRIYLDQNIIGYSRNGWIDLAKFEEVDWIYSKEHFREISRSDDPRIYLSVLETLKAKEIEMILEDRSKITDLPKFNEYSCPYEKYNQFINTNKEVDFDENIFAPIIARCYGDDNYDEVLKFPDKLKTNLECLLGSKEFLDEDIAELSKQLAREFEETVVQGLSKRHSLNDIRKGFGLENGKLGQISGANSIKEIWRLLEGKPNITGGMTCEQFFSFEPIHKQGYESWPLYLGIVGCYTMLNSLGYRTDKGVAKQENVSNIASDARHVAYAAYCDALMSGDKKLYEKASAIYGYKKINTVIISATVKNNY